jgi:hypothetical protein
MNKSLVRCSYFLLLMIASAHSLRAQTDSAELKTRLSVRVQSFNLSAANLADALAKTSVRFQIPIGVEWVKNPQTQRSVSRTWSDNTVLEVINSIVESYHGYGLKVDNGVVNVFRQDLLKDSRNFLDLKVPDFLKIRQQVGGIANLQLRSVVQKIVSPLDLPPGVGEATSYATGIEENPITVDVSGRTIRDALNRLATLSEHKIWIVTFSDSGLTPTGFLRTETLWHPSPFPNTQQPMWDFLTWTQYPFAATQANN